MTKNHFGNGAFHCINPATDINLQLNEYSFGEVPARHPWMDRRIAGSVRPVTPASPHGPLMKRDSQAPLPAPGNSGIGTNRNTEKYHRILEAAVAVFADKCFFNSRNADIASRADLADSTVYLYFKNKDEILMTAINTAFDAFMRNTRTEVEKLPSPAERLRRLAFLHLDALGSNRNLAVVFQIDRKRPRMNY